MFDEQDKEDDFNGVDQGSRAEIAEVAVEIERSIQTSRFLLILHNGSNEEIDRCQDLVASTEAKKVEDDATKSWACFRSLWVLDLRYTDWDRILSAQMMDLMTQLMELNLTGAKNWDMSHLQGRLRNIRKLRIIVYVLQLRKQLVLGGGAVGAS